MVGDRITRAARSERIRAEEALAGHMTICLSCNRQARGIAEDIVRCDIGRQLTRHVSLMRKQEKLLDDDDWVQDTLF